jgi:ankyrin repeat protein|tara:strand:+ start:154 stop:450 length:297 start_codon:yes stop_codon:yes gene_type:complete
MEQNLCEEIRVWVNQFTLKDDGWTSLHLATQDKSKEIFFYVYQDLGANINVRNKNGVSLMHKAASDNNTYLITYLRDKTELSISDVDYDGNTPLHYAC